MKTNNDNFIEGNWKTRLLKHLPHDITREDVGKISAYISEILQDQQERIVNHIQNVLREPNLSVAREKGSEFTTPRMYRAFGRDDGLKEVIKSITGDINKLSTE